MFQLAQQPLHAGIVWQNLGQLSGVGKRAKDIEVIRIAHQQQSQRMVQIGCARQQREATLERLLAFVLDSQRAFELEPSTRRPRMTTSRSTPSSRVTPGSSPQRAKPNLANNSRLGRLWPKTNPISRSTPMEGA